jgi:hypothetical protein
MVLVFSTLEVAFVLGIRAICDSDVKKFSRLLEWLAILQEPSSSTLCGGIFQIED